MTDPADKKESLLSSRPALALPEVAAFSLETQPGRLQRRVYYFNADKHFYHESKVLRVLSTVRVAWFSNRPAPSGLLGLRGGSQAFGGISQVEIPLALHGYPAYLIIDEFIPSESTLCDLFSAISKDVGVAINQRLQPFMDPILSTIWARLGAGIELEAAVKGLDFSVPVQARRTGQGFY